MRFSAILLATSGLTLSALNFGCYSAFPGQGITNEYRSYIPMTAQSVGTGDGSVSYVASQPGTVYLIDHNRYDQLKKDDKKHYAPHVIGSYVLERGQSISVDGSTQTITVGGTGSVLPTVFNNPNLTSENSYELRIDPRSED